MWYPVKQNYVIRWNSCRLNTYTTVNILDLQPCNRYNVVCVNIDKGKAVILVTRVTEYSRSNLNVNLL